MPPAWSTNRSKLHFLSREMVPGAGPERFSMKRFSMKRFYIERFSIQHLAVAHVQDAVADSRRLWIVRNHHYGLLQLLVGAAQDRQHGLGILGIKIACRLVGQHDGGTGDQGAGDRDPLLLSTRQFRGPVLQAISNPKQVGEMVEVFPIELFRATGNFMRQQDIVHGAEGRQQVEFLKHKTDLLLAQPGTLRIAQSGEIDAVNQQAPGGWPGQASDVVKKRRLSASGGANDTDKLPGLNLEGNGTESLNFDFSCAINFAEMIGEDDWLHSGFIVPVEVANGSSDAAAAPLLR